MSDLFRHPFVRSNNYLGAYNVQYGDASLPVLESMEFDAAGAVFNGVATIVFGQAAQLFAPATVAGLGAITFSQQGDFSAAQLTAGAVLAGDASLVFDQAAGLGAASGMSGTANIAISETGVLSAPTALNGGATIGFGQTGNLLGPAIFTGPATVTFDQSGTFSAAIIDQPALDPIYSAAWMPVIRLDKNGKRISDKALKRKTIQVVPEAEKPKVKAAFERIEAVKESPADFVALEEMARDLQSIMALIPSIQFELMAELQRMADAAIMAAEDERDVELLLLAM